LHDEMMGRGLFQAALFRRRRRAQDMKANPHTASIESFYHLPGGNLESARCQGTACFVARHLKGPRQPQAASQAGRVYCLGRCYAAPVSGTESADEARPAIEVHARQAIVLERLVAGPATTLEGYLRSGGYAALEKALRQKPEAAVCEVEGSGLRGRGGAGFPTGKKWRAVFREESRTKYVIANADEGDPGVFIDRFLLEQDPFCLLEAMTIAAYAVGAQKGIIYLRQEYPKALAVVNRAITQARQRGMLGSNRFNGDFHFDVEVVIGRGSYVCGEETALLNSVEGRRPEVRQRPPYPTQQGLWGKPTLVNNVETLASIPWIIRNGGDSYRDIGFSESRGTKVVALNSLFCRPGLYEIDFGTPLRQILEDLGGGLRSGAIKGVLIGGPLAGVVPPGLFDTPFAFEELRAIGASVGHGGIVAFDEHTSIAELMHHVFAFGAYESCGKCTPCRMGSRVVEQLFQRLVEQGQAAPEAESDFQEVISALAETSLCGLGTGLAEFALSVSRHYTEEMRRCFR
jgi:NADH:ubiquinone oxidoreductase subunit F (NADH-binding)